MPQSSFVVSRRLAIIALPAAIAGCAMEVGFDSAGKGCIGFGCPSASSRPAKKDRITIVLIHATVFQQPIKASIDNFLSRYRINPKDTQINFWLDDFFQPAKRIIGKNFEFEPTLGIAVDPKQSTIWASVKQDEWREVDNTAPSFVRFASISGMPLEQIVRARWKVEINSQIWPANDTMLSYRSLVELILETKAINASSYSRVTSPDMSALRTLTEPLISELTKNYTDHFEQKYGMKVINRDSATLGFLR